MVNKVRSLKIGNKKPLIYYLSPSYPCFVTKATWQILRLHSLLLIIYLPQQKHINTFSSINQSFSNPRCFPITLSQPPVPHDSSRYLTSIPDSTLLPSPLLQPSSFQRPSHRPSSSPRNGFSKA